jgi:hypothetical protein
MRPQPTGWEELKTVAILFGTVGGLVWLWSLL